MAIARMKLCMVIIIKIASAGAIQENTTATVFNSSIDSLKTKVEENQLNLTGPQSSFQEHNLSREDQESKKRYTTNKQLTQSHTEAKTPDLQQLPTKSPRAGDSLQTPTSRYKTFPHHQFLGLKFIDGHSRARYLCGIPTLGVKKVCGCHKRCIYTRSCCIDYMWNPKVDRNLDSYLKRFVSEVMKYKNLSCEKIFNDEVGVGLEYLIVSHCTLKHTNITVQCEHRSDEFELPVIGIDGYVYRNRFCAQCNNVPWMPMVKGKNQKLFEAHCRAISNESSINLKKGIRFKDCIYTWNGLDDLHFQRCFNNSCSNEGPLHDLCRSYSAPIYGYQNYHCFLCSGGINLKGRREPASAVIPPLIPFLYPWSYSVEYNNRKITVFNVQMQFPLMEFLGLGKRDITYQSQWSHRVGVMNLRQLLCSKKNKYRSPCCSCSATCMETRTCCIDKLWDPKNPPSSLISYTDMFLLKSKEGKHLDCGRLLAGGQIQPKLIQKRLMVTGCEKNSSLESFEKCLNVNSESSLDAIEAVLGSDGYLYRNRYCAFCNSVYNFTCVVKLSGCSAMPGSSFTTPLKTALERNISSNCPFSVTENNPMVKGCPSITPPSTSGCDRRNTNYALCSSYLGEIESFSNYHCMKCLLGENASVEYRIQKCQDKGTPDISNPWSSYLWSSADLFPPPPVVSPKKTSRLKIKNINNAAFDKCLLARNLSIVAFNYSCHMMNNLSKALDSINIVSSLFYAHENLRVLRLRSLANISLDNITSRMASVDARYNASSRVLLIPLTVAPSELRHNLDMSRWYPGGRMCAHPIPVEGRYNFTSQCNVISSETETDLMNTTLWVDLQNNTITRKVYICRRFYLHSHCLLKSLPSEEYILDERLNLVNVRDNHSMFTVAEYIPRASGYSVCDPNEKTYPIWLKLLFKAEGYISVIGTSLSVVSYVCIILIYFWYKVLRNMGGLIGLVMCCSLFFADSLQLLTTFLGISSSSCPIVCEIIAISIHYALLSAHMWSAVLAFDIASNFGASLPKQRSESRRYKYFGIGFGVPLIMIACSITLNYTDAFTLGYGEGNECFITNPNARLAFYTLPVGLMVVSNIAMVIFTIILISRQKKANEEVLGQSSRSAFHIRTVAIRLIVTIGLTEVFGFVILPGGIKNFGLVVLRSICNFLYSFLRSIRGVLLFFAYLCRGPVFSLMRASFKESRNKWSSRWHHSSTQSDVDHDDNL